MDNLKKTIEKHILKVLIGIIILVVFFTQLEKFNSWFFVQGPFEIKNFFYELWPFSIPCFILIYVIANIVLIPSYPFVFASGIVFGLIGGVIISLISEILSATINFFIGRKFGRKFFIQKTKYKKIEFAKKYINKHGFNLILILRYLGFYFDIVSYTAGITKIKYTKYILATFIGFIPYILIYVYAGHQLINIKSSSFVYTILIFKLVLLSAFVIGYMIYNLKKKITKL